MQSQGFQPKTNDTFGNDFGMEREANQDNQSFFIYLQLATAGDMNLSYT